MPAASRRITTISDYYRAVAAGPGLLEFLRGRELYFSRFDGSGLERAPPLGGVDDLNRLIELGAVELRVTNARAGISSKPDWLALALRPSGRRDRQLFTVAEATHQQLNELGFESLWKVSGAGGLHVLLPIQARHGYRAVLDFAQLLADLITARVPEAAVTRAANPTRQVQIDISANRREHLLLAPFSVRAGFPARISQPLPWQALREALWQSDAVPEFDLTIAIKNIEVANALLRGVMARPNDLETGFITLEGQLQFAC